MPETYGHTRPIIFVGPSISADLARQILPSADFRPPIKRGDLDRIAAGYVVGIIDGVFAQSLAVSPGEIRDAISRGVVIFGASSMGALRSAEVRGLIGVGHIFEMYRSGEIERDDEVALVFDPESFRPLSEPLVNIRYAVERLVRSTTLSRCDGNAILAAATRLHYSERTYRNIFNNSSLKNNSDRDDIIRLLTNFNLKQDDAQLLLETIALHPPVAVTAADAIGIGALTHDAQQESRVRDREHCDAEVMVWEYGDFLKFRHVIRFLKVTGSFDAYARRALGRFAMAGSLFNPQPAEEYDDSALTPQALLDSIRAEWGWESPEEAHVTLRDLGLGLEDLGESLSAEIHTRRNLGVVARLEPDAFVTGLRAELWMSDLALKHEVLRLGSLNFFASEGAKQGSPTDDERSDAMRVISRLHHVLKWPEAVRNMTKVGLSESEIDHAVDEIVFARRSGRHVVKLLDRNAVESPLPKRSVDWKSLGLPLQSSPKARGSNRFSKSGDEALSITGTIAKQIGVLRIGMIGELDTLGVHVAQAFGERTGWSASFSSGKAETREGARVGSIMEEVEIHAQDAFKPTKTVWGSFRSLSKSEILVNPRTLDLPYDSRYTEAMEMEWTHGVDLINGCHALAPIAGFVKERVINDIYYSTRLGTKLFSSSGLGSGFSLAEAILHAAAEYIERHALRMADLVIDNFADREPPPFWFVDPDSLPTIPRRIIDNIRSSDMCVRILDITSDITVPTYYVKIFEDPFSSVVSMSSDGTACHPDPEVAVTMALLEAAQTRVGAIAGAREDFSLRARSLGRNERPTTMLPRSQVFWFGNDRPTRLFDATKGLISTDILTELEWMVERVSEAGLEKFIVMDYTMPRVQPAYAVRVVIPGAETANCFFTGPRARAMSIRDLLPRPI